MKRLPSELEDAVIDFCHDDHGTLASCGLVCRAWLPASRYHLFCTISLTMQNAAAFMDLISRSTTIAPLVCDVELHFFGSSLLHLEIAPLLMRLPHTTRLTLRPKRDEVVRPPCTSSLAHALPALPALVHLKFDFRARFESLEQIITCVCLCPHLESLEIGGSWQRTGKFLAGPPRLPRGLHTLTLTCDLANFLAWFMELEQEMGMPPVIQHLHLYHIVQREVETVAKDMHASDQLTPQTDLSLNTSLRTLALEGASPGITSALIALLSQLTLSTSSSSSSPLSIELTIRHPNSLLAVRLPHTHHWSALDEALTAASFSRRRLTLGVKVVEPLTCAPVPGAVKDVLAQLPFAKARGILLGVPPPPPSIGPCYGSSLSVPS
ncbi:hypothetical protein C8R46DRAFT_1349214 [Mycena filopes]|nr:hypothetical protein C8R46DRAFT_1349214 [Mycena filopes]